MCLFMYFLCFSWFSVDGHFFCYCTNTQRVNKLLPPWTVYKRKQSFFLFSFRLKNISSFTTRSLVEQLLQFLFVFFHVPAWNCIVFCRNYSVFFQYLQFMEGVGSSVQSHHCSFGSHILSLAFTPTHSRSIGFHRTCLTLNCQLRVFLLFFCFIYVRCVCLCGCKFCLFCFLRRQ